MKRIRHTGFIGAHTTNTDGIWRVRSASALVGVGKESKEIEKAPKNDNPHNAFNSGNNEVSTELFRFLMMCNQLCSCHITEVASIRLGGRFRSPISRPECSGITYPNHDWQKTALFRYNFLRLVVNFEGQFNCQPPLVRRNPFASLKASM